MTPNPWTESQEYWENRWSRQGPATVGHVGDSKVDFDSQTVKYTAALKHGLLTRREPASSWKSLLDFGCGWGRLYPALSDLADEYIGVDLSSRAVQLARETHPRGVFTHWRTVMSEGRPKHFDAIVVCTVLQHIVDPTILEQTVGALLHMLRDKGRIVLLENMSRLPPKGHIIYRQPQVYMDMFPGFSTTHLDTILHRGEDHALIVLNR